MQCITCLDAFQSDLVVFVTSAVNFGLSRHLKFDFCPIRTQSVTRFVVRFAQQYTIDINLLMKRKGGIA
jgi:hypothetical protein